jgi:hypothetical protein
MNMNQATKETIKNLIQDYYGLKALGNSVMKSAYLSATGRGYTEVVNSDKDSMLLRRPIDDTYICITIPEKEIETKVIIRERVAMFHIVSEIFDKEKAGVK